MRAKDFNCSSNAWVAGPKKRGRPSKKCEAPAKPVNPPPLKPFTGFVYEERREGAHDYRNIPSLMGGVRVPYHGIRGRSGG